jgi:hypothetical protein
MNAHILTTRRDSEAVYVYYCTRTEWPLCCFALLPYTYALLNKTQQDAVRRSKQVGQQEHHLIIPYTRCISLSPHQLLIRRLEVQRRRPKGWQSRYPSYRDRDRSPEFLLRYNKQEERRFSCVLDRLGLLLLLLVSVTGGYAATTTILGSIFTLHNIYSNTSSKNRVVKEVGGTERREREKRRESRIRREHTAIRYDGQQQHASFIKQQQQHLDLHYAQCHTTQDRPRYSRWFSTTFTGAFILFIVHDSRGGGQQQSTGYSYAVCFQ